jgi:hypothetical protein
VGIYSSMVGPVPQSMAFLYKDQVHSVATRL